MPFDRVRGCRVLVVEDEMFIGLEIEDLLLGMGCVVTGPIARLEIALEMAGDEGLDAAILDVSIRGGDVYPVAERLIARGIPFVLASGHGEWALPENLRDRPRLAKPFTRQEFEECVKLLCAVLPERCAGAGEP